MKKVILVRHGHYASLPPQEDQLDDLGARQIREMTHYFKDILPRQNVALLSSEVDRAKQSAAIVGNILGFRPRAYHCFFGDNECPGAVMILERLEPRIKTAVIVGHEKFIEIFPGFLLTKQRQNILEIEIGFGDAVIVEAGRDIPLFVQNPLTLARSAKIA